MKLLLRLGIRPAVTPSPKRGRYGYHPQTGQAEHQEKSSCPHQAGSVGRQIPQADGGKEIHSQDEGIQEPQAERDGAPWPSPCPRGPRVGASGRRQSLGGSQGHDQSRGGERQRRVGHSLPCDLDEGTVSYRRPHQIECFLSRPFCDRKGTCAWACHVWKCTEPDCCFHLYSCCSSQLTSGPRHRHRLASSAVR